MTFVKVVTKNSQTAAGALKLKTGFAKFAHPPELMKMYKEFADIQSAEKLNLSRPKLKMSRPQIVVVKRLRNNKNRSTTLQRAKKVDTEIIDHTMITT